MTRNLATVAEFASRTPFTQGQLRWWIFNAQTNGLSDAGVIVRVQRRVYLDIDAFGRWVESQNQTVPA